MLSVRSLSRSHMVVVACALLASAIPACAQSDDPLHIGMLELGLIGGDSVDGLAGTVVSLPGARDLKATSPGSGFLAVRTGVAVNAQWMFYGQVGVLVGEHVNRPLADGYDAQTNLVNVLYEGGFEWFPRFWPAKQFYFTGAAATFEKRVTTLVTYVNPNPSTNQLLSSATSLRIHGAGFAVEAGLGYRHNFHSKRAANPRSRFGFNAELKAYFPTSGLTTPLGMASAGLFVDFR